MLYDNYFNSVMSYTDVNKMTTFVIKIFFIYTLTQIPTIILQSSKYNMLDINGFMIDFEIKNPISDENYLGMKNYKNFSFQLNNVSPKLSIIPSIIVYISSLIFLNSNIQFFELIHIIISLNWGLNILLAIILNIIFYLRVILEIISLIIDIFIE
jgi:hypothetical protein